MSNRAITAVFDYSRTRGSARLLMLSIADGLNTDTNSYTANVDTLAAHVNCHRRFVQKLIRRCLSMGELIVADRIGRASVFYIPIYDGEAGYDLQTCREDWHVCLGSHTPLSVSREEAKRQEVRQHRARRKLEARATDAQEGTPTRAQEGIPPPQLGYGDAQEGTHPRPIGHPPTPNRAPTHAQEGTHYPLVTPLDTHLEPTGAAPHISFDEWMRQQTPADKELYERKASAAWTAYRAAVRP